MGSEGGVLKVETRELREEEMPFWMALQAGMSVAQAEQLSYDPLIFHCWVLGAWLEGNLVGGMEVVRSVRPDYAVGVNAVVAATHQRIGIGSLLYKERGRFLLERGISKVVTAVSIWNTGSLIFSLNKNMARGVKYLRDCYFEGEDKLWMEKDLREATSVFDEAGVGESYRGGSQENFVPVTPKELFLNSRPRRLLESLVNTDGFHVIGLVRPRYSGCDNNLLVLKPRREGGDNE